MYDNLLFFHTFYFLFDWLLQHICQTSQEASYSWLPSWICNEPSKQLMPENTSLTSLHIDSVTSALVSLPGSFSEPATKYSILYLSLLVTTGYLVFDSLVTWNFLSLFSTFCPSFVSAGLLCYISHSVCLVLWNLASLAQSFPGTTKESVYPMFIFMFNCNPTYSLVVAFLFYSKSAQLCFYVFVLLIVPLLPWDTDFWMWRLVLNYH